MTYLLLILVGLIALAWLAYKLKLLQYCPICAATVLTWAAGLALYYINITWVNPLFIAILLGASLGAVADKYGSELGFLWKSLWVILGSVGIFFLLEKDLAKGIIVLLGLAAVTLIAKISAKKQEQAKDDKFKHCC